jgi:hypothetical protein
VDELQLQPCPSDFCLVNLSHFAKKISPKGYSATNSLLFGRKTKKIQKNHKKLSTIAYNRYARVIKILHFHILNIAKFG